MSEIDTYKFEFRKFSKEIWLKCKEDEEQAIDSETMKMLPPPNGDPRFDENAARICILESNCESIIKLLELICGDFQMVCKELEQLGKRNPY